MAKTGIDDSFLVRAIRFAAQALAQAINTLRATNESVLTETNPGSADKAQVTIGKHDEEMLVVLDLIRQQQTLTNLYLAQMLGHTFEEGEE